MFGTIRWSVVSAVMAAVAWAVFALAAPAQPPELFPDVAPKAKHAPTYEDPDVKPAAATAPGDTLPPALPPRPVPDPPTPVVRIQVRVPADAPPGDDIKYIITVQNTSSADAHGVTVRNPINSEMFEAAVKAEPEWDKTKSDPKKELVWSFGTLAAGKTKSIELSLKPKAGAAEVKNLAYVRFEHGEAVTTKIHKPAVRVTKFAPKQTVRDEAYTVRITLENTGKVHAESVRVVENLPPTAEIEAITKGGKRTDKRDAPANGQQWVWEISRIMPGEKRIIEYRVTPHEAKDIYALTSLDGAKGVTDRAEARTAVLVPGLTVKLGGPKGVINPGEAAKYEITVRNTGTLPSQNLRVTGTLPADCKLTKKTEGGQIYRDAIQWTIPRLDGGDAQTFRFEAKATTTGKRVVVASVADARGQRAVDETATLFQGTAALVWESVPNPASLAVGRQGTFTVRVRNLGGEEARNVKLEIDVPDAVSVVQVTPKLSGPTNRLTFGPETIAANGEATYTVTFEAHKSANAWFKLKLTADSLSSGPLQTEKAISITGGK